MSGKFEDHLVLDQNYGIYTVLRRSIFGSVRLIRKYADILIISRIRGATYLSFKRSQRTEIHKILQPHKTSITADPGVIQRNGILKEETYKHKNDQTLYES